MFKNTLKILPFASLFVFFSNVALFAASRCTVNGQEIPCDQFWDQFGWLFVILYVVLGVVGLGMLLFWAWMLIDCVKRDFKDKPLWILIILLGQVIGAVVYLIVVKSQDKKA